MANYNAIKYDGFSKGSTTLIKTLTASSDDTLEFVDGTSSVVLDSTYKEYMFIFNNLHVSADNADFVWQANAAGGSGYNETITSTYFRSHFLEGGSDEFLIYNTTNDQAQGTGFNPLLKELGYDNDQSGSGYLHLFNPSGTTFAKHFISKCHAHGAVDSAVTNFTAGYLNTTSAIDEVQFKMSSGDIDAGTIQLFGVA
jgi:hypothetical protein